MPPQRTKKGRYLDESSVLDKPLKRGPWNTTEDERLKALVDEKGAGKWVQISNELDSRSPKQCRERWHQNLKPELNHAPISEEEGKFIEDMVSTMGKKWAEIARRMTNRSDNAVKNWWNGGENRRKREQARAQESSHAICRMIPQNAMAGPPYPHYHDHRPRGIEHLILPLPQGVHSDMRIAIPETHRQVESGEPSPLAGKPPSLMSDADSEQSMGYRSHRQSFSLSTPQLGQPFDMRRTHSNESWGLSPDRSYHLPRDPRYGEDSPVLPTDIVHGKKHLPSLEYLTNANFYHRERPQSGGARPFSEGVLSSQPGLALPPLRSIDPNHIGPSPSSCDNSKYRMSLDNLLHR